MDLSPGIETTPLRELELKARITVGLGFKVDSYRVGVGYINGDETFPLSNTFQLTINVEI